MSWTMTSDSWSTAECSSAASARRRPASSAEHAARKVAERQSRTRDLNILLTIRVASGGEAVAAAPPAGPGWIGGRTNIALSRAGRNSHLSCPAPGRGPEEQGPGVVAGDEQELTLRGAQPPDVAGLPGNAEAAHPGGNGGEAPGPLAAQEEPLARAQAADVRLHAIEVAGQQQVGAAVAVDVRGEDAVHRRELRLPRQRRERERAITIAACHRCREGVRPALDRARQVRGAEDVGRRRTGVVRVAQEAR